MDVKSGTFLFINLLESFLTSWAFMKAGRFEPGNIMTGVFFLFSFFLYRMIRDRVHQSNSALERNTVTTAAFLSIMFSLLYMAVDYRHYIQDLSNPAFKLMIILSVFAGFCILFYKLLLLLYSYTGNVKIVSSCILSREQDLKKQNKFITFYSKHMGLCTFFLCLLFWLPYFLYQYPGIMTPDSINQFEQVLGVIPYSNHHPWVHTLLIKLLYSFGSLFTSNMVTALSFYTFFQMCAMSLTVCYLVSTLKLYKIKPVICLAVTCFYAVVPYNAVFAVTLWKDILFAASVMLLGCSMLRLFLSVNKRTLSIFILSGIMLCLFRSNGWYAFLLCFPFLLYHYRRKAKIMVPVILSILLTAIIIKYPVMNAFHVTPPDMVESLSIPIQQVASVICNDRPLTKEQHELINQVIDTTYIKELYNPTYADNMKELVRAGHPDFLKEHKSRYLKLWMELGITYPGDYLNAYINQTYGYWYPDCFYPVADAEGVSGTNLGISHTPLIGGPLVVKGKEIAIKLGDMIPVYSLLFSMGVVFWIFLFCIGTVLVRRETNKLILYLPSLALFLTVMIATPVASEFRYIYFMIFSLPFYLITSFIDLPKKAAS